MPTATIKVPNGKFLDIEYQEGMTDDEIIAFADQQFAQNPDIGYENETTWGEFATGAGIDLGLIGTLRAGKALPDLASWLAPESTGIPELLDPVVGQFEEAIEAAEQLKPEAYREEQKRTFVERDAQGNPIGWQMPSAETVMGIALQTIPEIPYFIAGGGIGKAAAALKIFRNHPKLAEYLGYGVANAALVAPDQWRQAYKEALEGGMPDEEARAAADATSLLTAGISFATGTAGGAVASKLGAQASTVPRAVAKGFVAEAPFEGIEESGQSFAEDIGMGRPLDFINAADRGLLGFTSGGIPGAGIAGAQNVMERQFQYMTESEKEAERRARAAEGKLLGGTIEPDGPKGPGTALVPAPTPIDPDDPAGVPRAIATEIEDKLGEKLPMTSFVSVENAARDGRWVVTDKSGTQYGPEMDQRDAAMVASILSERGADRVVENNTELSVQRSGNEYDPDQRSTLSILARRLFHPRENTYTQDQVNRAAGEQVAQEARRYTIDEVKKLLGGRIGNLSNYAPAIIGGGRKGDYKRFKGKAAKGTPRQRRGRGLEQFRAVKTDSGYGVRSTFTNEVLNSGFDPDTGTRIQFTEEKEAKDYAAKLNGKIRRGDIVYRAEITDPQVQNEDTVKQLLAEKNISSDLRSPEMDAVVRAVTGRNVGNLSPTDWGLLHSRLRSLPVFEKPTKLPDFRSREYTPDQYRQASQVAENKVSEQPEARKASEALPTRAEVENATGALPDSAWAQLETDLKNDPRWKEAGTQRRATEQERKAADRQIEQRRKQEVEAVMSQVKQRLSSLKLKNVKTNLVDYIKEAAQGSVQDTGTVGAYRRSINEVFLALESLKAQDEYRAVANESFEVRTAKLAEMAVNTLNHEVIHAMRQADLFTKGEWDILKNQTLKQVKRDYGGTYFEWAKEFYPDLSSDAQFEEAVAEMVRDTQKLGPDGKPLLQVGGKPRNLIDRIIEFLQGMLGFKEQGGYSTFDDIIVGIESGVIGSRPEGQIRTPRALERGASKSLQIANDVFNKAKAKGMTDEQAQAEAMQVVEAYNRALTDAIPAELKEKGYDYIDDVYFSRYKKARYSNDRLEKIFDEYLPTSPYVPYAYEFTDWGKPTAAIAFIRPGDFLPVATPNGPGWKSDLWSQVRPLDVDTLRREEQTPWLMIEPVEVDGSPEYREEWFEGIMTYDRWESEPDSLPRPEGFRVWSHEGRHRTGGMDISGIEEMPVVLVLGNRPTRSEFFDALDQGLLHSRYGHKPIAHYFNSPDLLGLPESGILSGQEMNAEMVNVGDYFRTGENPDTISYRDMIPITPENKDLIRKRFGPTQEEVEAVQQALPLMGFAQKEYTKGLTKDELVFSRQGLEQTTVRDNITTARQEQRNARPEDYRAKKRNTARILVEDRTGLRSGQGRDGRVRFDRIAGERTDGGVRVLATYRPGTAYQQVLNAATIEPVTLNELASSPENATLYQEAIERSRSVKGGFKRKGSLGFGAAVYVYSQPEYQGMRLFLSPDQRYGFAVKQDGDIVSVFSDGGGKAYPMLALAVEQGGTKLDAFDTILPRMYRVAGFREVGRDAWNEDYRPDGWSKEVFKDFNNGEPDVVYMEYDAAYNPFAEGDVVFSREASSRTREASSRNWLYDRYGTRVFYSDDRLSDIWSNYGYANGRVIAAVAEIDPADFIRATSDKGSEFQNELFELQLDRKRLAESKAKVPELEIDEYGNIIGHEGRHRMGGFYNEGVRSAPVVIVRQKSSLPYDNKTLGLSQLEILSGQRFFRGTKDEFRGEAAAIKNPIDISWDNWKKIKQKHGAENAVSDPNSLAPDDITYSRESDRKIQREIEDNRLRYERLPKEIKRIWRDKFNEAGITDGEVRKIIREAMVRPVVPLPWLSDANEALLEARDRYARGKRTVAWSQYVQYGGLTRQQLGNSITAHRRHAKTLYDLLRNNGMDREAALKVVDDMVWSRVVNNPQGVVLPRTRLRDMDGREIGGWIKKWWSRNFRAQHNLPNEAWFAKQISDAQKRAENQHVEWLLDDFEKAVKKAYKKPYIKLPATTQRAMNDFLADPDGGTHGLPRQVVEALRPMRTYIDMLSTRMVEEGVVDGEAAQTVLDNRGHYLHRAYQMFDDVDWEQKIEPQVWEDAIQYLMAEATERGQLLGEPTPTDQAELRKRATALARMIVRDGTAFDSFGAFVGGARLMGRQDLSMLKKKKDIAPQIRRLMGEYLDPKVNFAQTATKMAYAVTNHRLLEAVREAGYGVWLFEPHEAHGEFTVRLAPEGSQTYGDLGGLYTTPEIKRAFMEVNDPAIQQEWVRHLLMANGMVKYAKTVLSVTTMARNFISASMFAMVNGHVLSPDFFNNVLASGQTLGQQLLGRDGVLRDGQRGRTYYKRLMELGVTLDNPYPGEMMAALQDAMHPNMAVGSAKQKVRNFFEFFTKLYQYGDDFWKIIGYESEKAALVRSGMSAQEAEVEAAHRIRNTYPTYSLIGKRVRQMRRFPLTGTFVSFPAEIIRTSGNIMRMMHDDLKAGRKELFARRLVGVSVAAGWASALSALSMAMLGIDDEDDEAVRKLSAPWMRNSNLAYVGYNDDGQLMFFDLSFLDPYNYLKRPINAMMMSGDWKENIFGIRAGGGLRDVLDPFIGPDIAAQAIGELVFNSRLDGTGYVYNPSGSMDQQALEAANHLRKAIQPGTFMNAERMFKAVTGDVSRSGTQYSLQDEMFALGGIRRVTMNPLQALRYKTYEVREGVSQAARLLSYPLGGQNKISDGDIRDAFDQMMGARQRLYQEMIDVVDLLEEQGIGKSEIARVLRSNGLGKRDTGFVLQGKVPPWRPTAAFLQKAFKSAMSSAPPSRRDEIREQFGRRRKRVYEIMREYYDKE